MAQYLHPRVRSKPLLKKIGLFTSPHLRSVCERIQINNEPLSENVFAQYFFEIWDRLEESARQSGKPPETAAKPAFFRYLSLMAFHAFMREGVDTAIIECGIGGEYDSTNIIDSPTVTGITSLGIDHVAILGETIEEIAWHKAGIMKSHVPSFTAQQPPSALRVLHQRAAAAPTSLTVVPQHTSVSDVKIGLAGAFQYINASLAVSIASSHLAALGLTDHAADLETATVLPPEFVRGLESTRWPGRCEVRHEGNIAWHIDGGHTLESIELASSWFASQIPPSEHGKTRNTTRILLFNQQTRDADALINVLYSTIISALSNGRPFTHVVFCTNNIFKNSRNKLDFGKDYLHHEAIRTLQVQKDLAKTWKELDPRASVIVVRSIEEAVGWCRDLAGSQQEPVMVFITGSIHLVGGFLEVLEGN